MSEITDFYQQQVHQHETSEALSWVSALQNDALLDFKRAGFPTRSDEEWKYTSVDAFLKQRFVNASNAEKAHDINHEIMPPIPCFQIKLINGVITGIEAFESSLPTGVVVLPLAQALVLHAEKIKPKLGHILRHQHGFQALNTAMLQCGLFIYLPADVHLSEPLWVSHWQDEPQQATYIRHLIIAEAGSSASIIEDYQGDALTAYLTNTMTEAYTAADAKVTHYKILRESQSAYHIGHLTVDQALKSQFDSHLFSFGGQLVRSDTTFNLQEPQARCVMNGVYAPAQGQHMDHHTVVNHNVPDCISSQDYKGILSGQSRAVFNGKVVVAKDAQHTEAKQQNKNLLLSKNAEIDTKPQLEIFANDVICTHGATVGQLDEEALFYLATRGIEHTEATQYLIQAFAAENLRAVPNAKLAAWLSGLLNEQIG